jgi:hypothetical protein
MVVQAVSMSLSASSSQPPLALSRSSAAIACRQASNRLPSLWAVSSSW